jgi:hypothetical protein
MGVRRRATVEERARERMQSEAFKGSRVDRVIDAKFGRTGSRSRSRLNDPTRAFFQSCYIRGFPKDAFG